MWQILTFIRVIIAYVLIVILIKKFTGLPSRNSRIAWQYFFCFVLSLLFAVGTKIFLGAGVDIFNKYWIIMFFIGIINSIAVYCYWHAVNISLSKTSLFTQADDLTSMMLGYLFLNEIQYFNTNLLIGVVLCFSAAAIFTLMHYQNKSNRDKSSNLALMGWVVCYSVIWGVAVFTMRYFALADVSFSSFLTSWYGGTFLGTLIILYSKNIINTIKFFIKRTSHTAATETKEKFSKKTIGKLFFLGLLLWLSMTLQYWIADLAPITVFLPIFLVSEMIFPCLVGFFLFKEIKQLTKAEIFAFAIGFIGIIAISLNF